MWPFAKKQSSPDAPDAPASEPEPAAAPEPQKFNVGKLFILLTLDDGEKVSFVCTGRVVLLADGKAYVIDAVARLSDILVHTQKTGFFGIRAFVGDDSARYIPVSRVRDMHTTWSKCFKAATEEAE